MGRDLAVDCERWEDIDNLSSKPGTASHHWAIDHPEIRRTEEAGRQATVDEAGSQS